VLLIVLWVRSYAHFTATQILVTPRYRYYLHSVRGTIAIERWIREFRLAEAMPVFRESDLLRLTTNAGLKIERSPVVGIDSLSFSYWLVNLFVMLAASLPCVPVRFNLRTLLIATTLLAVMLGLVVWAVRG
jgi:hypothetical protein